MTLTLPVLQAGLSDVGRSPPVDKQHPATLVYRTLSLASSNLTDISLLAAYPYLTSLDLSHNALAAGTTAATLSRLPHLSTLALDHCRLTSFTLASPLSSLLSLSLAHNRLSALPSLSLSPFLTSLDVSHNAFASLSLSPLRYLQRLDASYNDVLYLQADSLPSPALSHLSLAHNRLFTLAHVQPLPALLTLDLSHNFFQSTHSLAAMTAPTPSPAGASHPLHTLVLAHNYIQSLSALTALPSLPHLRSLALDGNSASRAVQYRADMLYLLPRLRTLDGAAVDVEAVAESEEAAGDDDERSMALWRDKLPSGHSTRKWQVDDEEKSQLAANQGRQAMVYAQQHVDEEKTAEEAKEEEKRSDSSITLSTHDVQSHKRLVRAYLPEQRYWQLMSERGLVHPWTSLHHHLTAAVAAGNKELLDLSHTALGECGLRVLAHWLAVGDGAVGVGVLDLTGALDARRVSSRLSNEYGFAHLLRALQSTAVHSLSLSRCQLTERQCALLSAHLASASCPLRHLDLSHNRLGSHLRRGDVVVQQCPALTGLLSAVEMTASTRPLLSLNLSHNAVDQLGCAALARFLAAPTCRLALLSLDGNPLSADGLSLLSHALHANASLVHVTLRHLPAGTLSAGQSLPRLSAALARFNRSVRVVDLTGSRVAEAQGTAVGAAVAELIEGRGRGEGEGVQEVRMKGVAVSSDGMAAVGSALRNNTTLRVLELGAADAVEVLSADSLVALCEGVAGSAVEELDLSSYSADVDSHATTTALAALLSHRSLRDVSLPQLSYSPQLDAAAQQQLTSAWQTGGAQWQRATIRGTGRPMSELDEQLLLAALSASAHSLFLSSLTLVHFAFTDSFAASLVAALADSARLVSLSLLSCQLSSTALSALLSGLPVGVREVDLSRTALGQFGVVLPRQSQLSALTLSDCALTSITPAALTSLLSLPSLTSLRLSNNPLSAASITSLASLVHKQTSSCPLRLLDASGCALSDGESCLQSLCGLVRAAGRALHELRLPTVLWLDGQQADGDSSVVLTRLLHALATSAQPAVAGGASGNRAGRLRRLVLPPSLPLLACHRRQLLALAQQGSQPALEWVGVQAAAEGEETVCDSVVADGSEPTLEDDAVLNAVAASFAFAHCSSPSQ